MASTFSMDRRVAFAETDAAGLLHFANYFRYMEEVEHAFFRSLGLRVHAPPQGDIIGWARRHAECSYRRPLRYEDLVQLQLTVREKGTTTLTYAITFSLDGEEVAQGSVTAVCVGPGEDGTGIRAVPMPEDVRSRIEAAD